MLPKMFQQVDVLLRVVHIVGYEGITAPNGKRVQLDETFDVRGKCYGIGPTKIQKPSDIMHFLVVHCMCG